MPSVSALLAGSSWVTITSTIGSKVVNFNISSIEPPIPFMVIIWSDTFVNSAVAKECFESLVKGENGINEIESITTHPNRIVLNFTSDVTDQETAKTLTDHFLRRLKTHLDEKFDELDLARWEYAEQRTSTDINEAYRANNERRGAGLGERSHAHMFEEA